jgi:hypothetical protein
MTHHQLVEEWKDKIDKWLQRVLSVNPDQLLRHCDFAFRGMLAMAMREAAKGAAEAARVELVAAEKNKSKYPDVRWQTENYGARQFNAAISKSERQLEDYFKEV